MLMKLALALKDEVAGGAFDKWPSAIISQFVSLSKIPFALSNTPNSYALFHFDPQYIISLKLFSSTHIEGVVSSAQLKNE
jgi:hypothetical protein